MRKTLCVALVLIGAAFAASAAPAPTPSPAADAGSGMAILFDFKSLLSSISEFEDGYQAGAGLKWWMLDNLALRGLAGLDFNTLEGTTTTIIGLSAAAEWHPSRRRVSPYLGGFLGARAAIDTESRVDLYFGGLGGIELRLWENLSLYAEYNLLASIDSDGFSVALGGADSAQLGLLIYF